MALPQFWRKIMKKFLVLLIMVFLAVVVTAETFYVDPDSADDSGTGLTSEVNVAKKTISGALAAVAAHADAASTIKLCAGTYDDDTQDWADDTNGCRSLPNKSITFEPYPAGTAITLLRTSEGNAYFFRNASDHTGKSFTFNNLTIQDARASSMIVTWKTNAGANYIFNTCTLSNTNATPSTGYIINSAETPASYAQERRLIMNNCTVTSTDNDYALLNLYGMTQVFIYNTTFTCSANNDSDFAIDIVNPWNATYIDSCTFNTNYGVRIQDIPRASDYVTIVNSNFTSLWTTGDYVGVAIRVNNNLPHSPVNAYYATVQNNVIKYYNNGIDYHGAYGLVKSNYVVAKDPMNLMGAYKVSVLNNTFKSSDSVATTGRATMFSRRFCAWLDGSTAGVFDGTDSYFTNDTMTYDTTYAKDGGAGDFNLSQVVADGLTIAFISDVTTANSPPPTFWGIVTSVSDADDQVNVVKWTKVSDGTTTTPTDGTGYLSVVRYASNNTVMYNILDAASATNTMTFDFNPVSGNNIIDYNAYYCGSAGISNLGTADIDTIADLRTKWKTWPTASDICYYNDTHSIEANPNLEVNGYSRNNEVVELGAGRQAPLKTDPTPRRLTHKTKFIRDTD